MDDDGRREYLAQHMSSDLQCVLSAQYDLAQHYKTVKVFSPGVKPKLSCRKRYAQISSLIQLPMLDSVQMLQRASQLWTCRRRWPTKRRTSRLRQRFWVGREFFSIQCGRRWSKQWKLSWESCKTARSLPTKGGKGSSSDFNGNTLVTHTPDNRELCFAVKAQGCSGKCGRVHACRVRGCYGKHSAREHHKYATKGTGKEIADE